MLCIVEPDKINKIWDVFYATYGPEIRISNVLSVDDIVGVGNQMVMESTVKT